MELVYKDHLCIRTTFCWSLGWSLYTSSTVVATCYLFSAWFQVAVSIKGCPCWTASTKHLTCPRSHSPGYRITYLRQVHYLHSQPTRRVGTEFFVFLFLSVSTCPGLALHRRNSYLNMSKDRLVSSLATVARRPLLNHTWLGWFATKNLHASRLDSMMYRNILCNLHGLCLGSHKLS